MGHDGEHVDARYRRSGVWYAILAYGLWGLLPLYWKLLQHVPSIEILAHRIFWSFVFVSILLAVFRRWQVLREVMSNKKSRLYIFFCSLLITCNWFLYIWGINNDHVIETSLGYYINPLLSIVLGVVVLKERLTFWQVISVVLAAIGVVIVTVEFGSFPWLAILLALTFAIYGLGKKMAKADSMVGLALETVIVAPVALIYLGWIEAAGSGSFGAAGWGTTVLLMGAGVATAMPLLWFAKASNRAPLSTLGFTQYLSPSITLLLGIFLFKETFTAVHAVSFGFIWTGLLLYSASYTKFMQGLQARLFRGSRKNVDLEKKVEV